MVQDEQTGRFHRISPAANHIVGLMDGRRSMAEIWEAATRWAGSGGEPPTQDEVIRLLAQMHHADLLSGDLPPDIDELAQRAESRESRAMLSRLKNPLALRLPLWDPDRFLQVTLPLARWAFGWVGLVLWLAVVGAGATIAVLHWDELTTGLGDRVFLAENLVLLALVYPVIKALHELGHGYAVKTWGGEVREVGLMFLVLIPVPYVDASSSSAFQSKWQRAVVAGAGILVELFIAALAMIVWVNAEPGLLRAAAFSAALIGGVSTLLFNGNPLLRFDGYYVFSDLIEIPNLGNRANRHVLYLIKRYLFGMRRETSPATARGERVWFTLYAVAAFCYRMTIMVAIALFVAGQLFFVGVALALWAVFNALFLPLLKGVWWLAEAPELRGRRLRAAVVSGAVVAGAAALFLVLPFPYATGAEGVVAVRERAVLNADGQGFVVQVHAGGPVSAGDEIVGLADPTLAARHRLLVAQRAEILLRLEGEIGADPVEAQILREQLAHVEAAIARLDERIANLSLRAPHDGFLLLAGGGDLVGRHVTRGTHIGYLVTPEDPFIHVAVDQRRADLVRRRLDGVDVVLADALDDPIPAVLMAATPKATTQLPSPALGTEGGGKIVLDPATGDPTRALEPHFLFDLAGPLPAERIEIGQRVHVRFDHGEEPLAGRMLRSVRQVFLRRFDV